MTYSARRRRRPPPRRRFAAVGVLLAILLVFGAVGFGTVATNAFGAGDLFDRLVAKVDRVINPVPERSTRPTVEVTAPPTRPTASPGASPTATPAAAVRAPVDVTIIDDPEAVFAHEARKDWCAPAGVQMTLAALGLSDTSDAFQAELHSRVREWESKADSRNGEWGPAAMALALEAYGAPGYEIRAYKSRSDAVRDAAVAITTTQSPAILLAWKGAHTWVMTGYTAEADPTIFPDAIMTGCLHPGSLVPVELNDLGPIRSARRVPGLARDGAQLPALEATRGHVPRPRREVHHPRPDDPGRLIRRSTPPRPPMPGGTT